MVCNSSGGMCSSLTGSGLKLSSLPKIHKIPDFLTLAEVEKLIGATRKRRYRDFFLTTYSMGLRLEEALSLQVGDIDTQRKRVHVRRDKGHKDRLVPLPNLTCQALRALWCKHRHPYFLFPNARGSLKTGHIMFTFGWCLWGKRNTEFLNEVEKVPTLPDWVVD